MSKTDDLTAAVRWCADRSLDPMIKNKLQQALDAFAAAPAVNGPVPKPGSRWEHHNGKIYRVLCLTNVNSDRAEFPPTVVYEDNNRRRWTRPLSEWHRSFKPALVEQAPLGLEATTG